MAMKSGASDTDSDFQSALLASTEAAGGKTLCITWSSNFPLYEKRYLRVVGDPLHVLWEPRFIVCRCGSRCWHPAGGDSRGCHFRGEG